MKRLSLVTLAALATGMIGAAGNAAAASKTEVAFVSIRTGDAHIFIRDAQGHERMVTQGKGVHTQPAWASNNRIAYTQQVGGAPKVFITNESGLAAQRLTADDAMETSPSWSPDGRALAYYSQPITGGKTELRVVDIASRKVTVLATEELEMGPTPASWSADGSRLAFSVRFDRAKSHAWIVQRDGSGLRNLTAKFAPRGGAWPNLSPDGRKLLWVADMRERMPIIVTDVESGESQDLTPQKNATAEAARWSPDGRQIVFASARDSGDSGRNDIFVMDADGANARNLSRHPGEDFDPKWSADGRSVVFASLRSGTSLLYEVDLVNGKTQPLAQHSSHDMDHMIRPIASIR